MIIRGICDNNFKWPLEVALIRPIARRWRPKIPRKWILSVTAQTIHKWMQLGRCRRTAIETQGVEPKEIMPVPEYQHS